MVSERRESYDSSVVVTQQQVESFWLKIYATIQINTVVQLGMVKHIYTIIHLSRLLRKERDFALGKNGWGMEPKTINSTELRTKTRDLMERVKFEHETFVIETFGRPMAVIISLEEYTRVQQLLAQANSPALTQLSVSSKMPPPARVNTRRRRNGK